MQTQKSIFGYRVLLEVAPVMFKISMQKSVALSVCEAEQTAGVLTRHDVCLECSRIYGTQGKAPMTPEMDNKGAVIYLANSLSIGGPISHVDVQQ